MGGLPNPVGVGRESQGRTSEFMFLVGFDVCRQLLPVCLLLRISASFSLTFQVFFSVFLILLSL